MDPATIGLLVNFGLKVGMKLVENHSGKKIGELSPAELLAALKALEIQRPEDLIAQGRAKARGARDYVVDEPTGKLENRPSPTG